MDERFLDEDVSPPGIRFARDYATVCEKRNSGVIYSTFFSEEGLESYLRDNEVEAVRVNDTELEPELLEPFEEEAIVSGNSGEVKAVVYGESEYMTFSSEDLDQETEVFVNPEEVLEQEVS